MLDANHLATWGLPGLFIVALLAGSVVPLPTEALISALVVGGQRVPVVLSVAIVGNVIGSTTLYFLGRWVAQGGAGRLSAWISAKASKEGARFENAKARLRTLGAPALLFAAIPIVGDVVVLAAGFVGVRPVPFLIFVGLGKGIRYTAVALSTAAAVSAVHG